MRVLRFLPVVAVAILLVALWGSIAGAQSFRTGDTVSTATDEVVDSTIYAAGNTVTIGSTVNGDVFCIGQTVTVTGTVNGDVICAAQNISISGEVNGDVRLAAQSITLTSNIAGNASILTQSFVQDASSTVFGDVSVAASDVTIDGVVGRDLAVSSGGDIILNGSVDRNITGNTENLTLSASSFVGGNIEYTSANELIEESGSTVVGTITRNEISTSEGDGGSIFGISLIFVLYIIVAALIVSLTLVLIIPRFFNSVTAQGYPKPWKALLVGFLASMLVPALVVFTLITIIGIPLGLTLGVAWLLVALLSGPFSAYLVGRWVMKDSNKPVAIMFIGSLVLLASYFIPVLGFFALIAAHWIGVGMLLLEGYSRWPKPTYDFANVKTARTTKKKK